MLMDVVKEEDNYFITIITIDRRDKRHYISAEMFLGEKNKIYSNFVLPASQMRSIEERTYSRDTCKFKYHKQLIFPHSNF
jgi:hypothetical protein